MSAEDVEDVESEESRDEALEEAAEEVSKDERRRSVALWFGVLGSPLAWVGHLGGNYSLEEWFACSESAHEEGKVLGLGVEPFSLLFNSAMLALAVLSGLVAYRCWKKLQGPGGGGDTGADQAGEGQSGGDEEGSASRDRARWMAFAGIVEGCLFVGIILLGYLPGLFLDVCETAP
ncbi:MAG TPA: hypothetical protein VHH09_06605 [Acidimicrobiales bacterium]|nr:hypothetical protein [Acidimicrobiales bacterium]